ncbi:hypothetical protein ACHQM5_010888 [Ranunculus cassubicifolius]
MGDTSAIIPIQLDQGRLGSIDEAILKQIRDIHDPNGHAVDVKTLFSIMEKVLQLPTAGNSLVFGKSANDCSNLLDLISANSMHKISKEIASNNTIEVITLSVCKILSSYTWYEKVVLALATYVVNYGEFWLVCQLYQPDQLANSIAKLTHSPEITDTNMLLRHRVDAMQNLIKIILNITKCIIEFKELPPRYISRDTPLLSNALNQIPNAVYWAIKGVLACSLQMEGLINLNKEYVTSSIDAWEVLSNLTRKVNIVFQDINAQLNLCYKHIYEKKQEEIYHRLKQLHELGAHIDNMEVLRALLSSNADGNWPQFIFDGFSKKLDSLDSLRQKNVILLITDIDISNESFEIKILEQLCSRIVGRNLLTYEILWLPVIEKSTVWTDEKKTQFENLRNRMPWYSVMNPTLLQPAVIRYIKEVWKFTKNTILVVLDPQGIVVNVNAAHMLWIWGALATPFTSMREHALWQEEYWRTDFLIDGIDATVLQWITEQRLICMYGGEDLEWIRKFTAAVREVSQVIHTPIELVYVGKSEPKERVKKIIASIVDEKLGYSLTVAQISFFWVRLESMYYSKMQQGKTFESDEVMKEVMTMLTLNGSEDGWAVFSKETTKMVKAKGEQMLASLTEIDHWKGNVDQKGFVAALEDHLRPNHKPEHCIRLILPGTVGNIPDKVVCGECGEIMEKYIMFRCCKD